MEIGKTCNIPVQQPILFFFILEAKKYFTITNIVKSQESPWSTILNFVDFWGKKIVLLY
jgi:hypothetical protein